MKIDRTALIKELESFSLAGNGIVIGNPGVGKSVALSELGDSLWKKNIPNYIIKIDEVEPSDDGISSEIGHDNWINTLNTITAGTNIQRGILIFDAFDAARDYDLRNRFLTQIRKAMNNLSDKWNVIVSVRTFDATKSPALLKLFPSALGSTNTRFARHFEIKELNSGELDSVFEVAVDLKKVYEATPDEFKKILKTPFFLRLLEIILINSSNEEIENFSPVKSEVELLNSYWKKKISDTENFAAKEYFLKNLSDSLVEAGKLSIDKTPFINSEVFSVLRSDDLIIETGINERDIAFSHNIFFDYIVGRLTIPYDYQELKSFIGKDNSRMFFLRPSLLFHFTQLWLKHRSEFWSTYFCLSEETDLIFGVFQRLLPVTVMAHEFENSTDFRLLFEKKLGYAFQQILQAIRFTDNRQIKDRDVEFLTVLSQNLDTSFLWDFSIVFDITLNNESLKEKFKDECGVIARNFFNYIITERNKNANLKFNLDRLGASRGIDFITETYNTNINESHEILTKVLNFLEEPGFEINYFSSLCRHFAKFVNADPAMVAKLYKAVFFHFEHSTEKTNMGGGVALNLISNRRQDFELCYYSLTIEYKIFLSAAPKIATKTALEIINNEAIVDKLRFYKSSMPEATNITINERSYKFLEDSSHISYSRSNNENYLKFPDEIFKYVEELLKTDVKEGIEIIDLYMDHAVTAYLWRKLIEFMNANVIFFNRALLDLALNEQILLSPDTSYEIGKSISILQGNLAKNQIAQIEENLVGILKSNESSPNFEFTEHRIGILLNCFDSKNLKNDESHKLLAAQNYLENRPNFTSSFSSTPYTTERYLKDQGVNIDNVDIQNLIDKNIELENFNRSWMNNTPPESEFLSVIPLAGELFKIVKSDSNLQEPLVRELLKEVSGAFARISRNTNAINDDLYQKILDVTKSGLSYVTEYDEQFDESSTVSAYSPTPMIEASNALVNLLKFKNDDEVFQLIKACLSGTNTIVRFNILKQIVTIWTLRRDDFWEFIFERMEKETDSMILAILIQSISYEDIIEEDEVRVLDAIKIASKHIEKFPTKDTFKEAYISLLLILLDNNIDEARQFIYKHIENVEFSNVIVFKILDFVDPKYHENDDDIPEKQNGLMTLFNDVIDVILNQLQNIDTASLSDRDSLDTKRISLIDGAVQKIFFALNIKEFDDLDYSQDVLPEGRKANFYLRVKPIISNIIKKSKKIDSEGLIMGHTAYNLVKIFSEAIVFLPREARDIIEKVVDVNELSRKTGYTFDYMAIRELVKFVEIILADHKVLLQEKQILLNVTKLLNFYVESGSVEALSLFWKLETAFK